MLEKKIKQHTINFILINKQDARQAKIKILKFIAIYFLSLLHSGQTQHNVFFSSAEFQLCDPKVAEKTTQKFKCYRYLNTKYRHSTVKQLD